MLVSCHFYFATFAFSPPASFRIRNHSNTGGRAAKRPYCPRCDECAIGLILATYIPTSIFIIGNHFNTGEDVPSSFLRCINFVSKTGSPMNHNRSLKLRPSSLHFFKGLKDMQSSSFQLPLWTNFLSRVFPLTANSPSLCIFSETLESNFAASFSMRLARPRLSDNNAMRDHTGVSRSTAKSKVWWDSSENNIYTMVITNV